MSESYSSINVMLPTYKRPERLRRFLDSCFRTAESVENLRISLCVNENDLDTKRALNSWYIPCPVYVSYEQTEQPNLAEYFNTMYVESPFRKERSLLSMFGDDMLFLTPGWDRKFLDAMNESEGRAIVYGDDDYIAHENLCVHFVISDETVRATKKPFMCPIYKADMIDVVWHMFGQMTGTLRYLPEVKIRHEHDSRLPKEKWDETMLRLIPTRVEANATSRRAVAKLYATVAAGNIIESGRASWATLY